MKSERLERFLTTAKTQTIIVDSKTRKEFLDLYLQTIGKNFDGCVGCSGNVSKALQELKKENAKTENIMTKEKKYSLKSGAQIYFRSINSVVTEQNLTDEVARLMLRGASKLINQFETFPSDWKEDIEIKTRTVATKIKEEEKPTDLIEKEKEEIEKTVSTEVKKTSKTNEIFAKAKKGNKTKNKF